MCMTGAWGGQKKASNPLELELRLVLNHHMVQELNPSRLQEHQVLLVAEPSLRPLSFLNLFIYFILDMVSRCSFGCPVALYVDQCG